MTGPKKKVLYALHEMEAHRTCNVSNLQQGKIMVEDH